MRGVNLVGVVVGQQTADDQRSLRVKTSKCGESGDDEEETMKKGSETNFLLRRGQREDGVDCTGGSKSRGLGDGCCFWSC